MTVRNFRALVLASVLLPLLGLAAWFMGEPGLPSQLRSYVESQPEPSAWELAGGGVLLVIWIGTVYGLWMLRAWGRTLFVLSVLGALAVNATATPSVTTGWFDLFCDAGLLTEGGLIGALYWSPLRQHFEAGRPAA